MTPIIGTPSAVEDTVPALQLRDVESGYGHTKVLRGVSLTVAPSSVTALIGPNGAGKTTLLKTASGLLKATSGAVEMDGKGITRLRPDQRMHLGMCHVPEGRAIYRSLSVKENLTVQAPRGSAKEAIERAASVFPILGDRLDQRAGTLSGGEQQMLALSAAYARASKVILVDEPSLGLAPIIVDLVFEYLERLKSEGIALLLVDQFATRALQMSSHAYVLRRGSIVFDGEPAELLAGDAFAQYTGEGLH